MSCDELISDLLGEEVKKLNIWSDNKFIANTLPWLCEKHSVNIEWHFLQHLKGCFDGVGGTIKRPFNEYFAHRR